MTASNREVGIGKTLTYEGGYCWDKHDPGGATNYGITIHDARLYWKPDATPEDVRNMPRSVAIEIYRQKYWAAMACDNRPSGPDVFEFDTGVNSGIGRVFQWRKIFDPQHLSPVDYVKAFANKRLSFLHALRTWQFFGKGWGSRVADLEAFCVKLALGATGTPHAPVLKKEAEKHAKRAIAHGTGSATAPLATHGLHFDLSTVAGCVCLGIGVLITAYFVWSYVQSHHRTNAYVAAAKT